MSKLNKSAPVPEDPVLKAPVPEGPVLEGPVPEEGGHYA
jgi:hypothetical protein